MASLDHSEVLRLVDGGDGAVEIAEGYADAVERVRTFCESRTGLIGAHVAFVTDVLRLLDGPKS